MPSFQRRRRPVLSESALAPAAVTDPAFRTQRKRAILSAWAGFAVDSYSITVAPLGVLPAYINERFATTVRSTGWGVAYSTAVIIPSFFSYYMIWLSAFVPFAWTAGVLAAFGALLILVATALGPETRGIDLRKAGDDADRTDVTPRPAGTEPAVVTNS